MIRDAPDDPSQAFLAQQTLLHARALPLSQVASLVVAGLLALALHGHVANLTLLLWAALLGCSMALRVWVRRRQRAAAPASTPDPRWRRHYRRAVLLQGLTWAAAGALIFVVDSPWSRDLLIYGVVGMAAGALWTLSFDRVAALAYAVPTALPILAYVLLQPHGQLPASALVVTLLLPLALYAMWASEARMRASVAQRVQQLRQTADLQRALDLVDRTGTVAGVGGWEVDAATRRLHLSPHALRLLGLPPGTEPTLDEALCLFGPDAGWMVQALDAALRDGTPIKGEASIVTRSGQPLIVRLVGEARRDGGRIVGVDGALQDVTRLHAIDRELADKHQLLEQLLRTARQGFCFADREGICTDLNPAMAQLLGSSREQLLGQPVASFGGAASRATLESELLRQHLGHAGGVEIDLHAPDGHLRRCLVHSSPLHDAAGEAIGSVSVWTDITQRFEAESALRVSNVVINASAEMISVVDSEHVYHLVNEAWLRATGVSRHQIIGHRMNEGVRSVLSDARLQAVNVCLSERRRQSVRDVVHFPGQGPRHLHTDYYPVHLDDRGPTLVAVVTRDITSDEVQRAALVAGAEYLRGTLGATGDAIFATDATSPDEPVRFANDQLFQLWGLPEELRAAPTLRQIAAAIDRNHADPAAASEQVTAIIRRGEPYEDRITLVDGRVLVRRYAPVPLTGRTLRVWSFRDVTAEVRAVDTREAAMAEQRALLDAFPGYIAVVDRRDVYQHVNERFAALLRRSVPQVIGQHVCDVLGPHGWQRASLALAEARLHGHAVGEAQYPHPDGRGELTLEVTHVAGPSHDDGRQHTYVFAIDITDRKRAQLALVEALTAAERANHAKSQFLSRMSHELRTPLNAVLGFGQLLAQQPLVDLHQQHVGEILRGGRHLLALINDLLDLGRIEAGELEVVATSVDTTQALAEVQTLLQPVAQERRVQVHLLTGTDPLAVWADARRLRQVLLNLLSNAIKYNHAGGQVWLECELMDGRAEFRVRDDGPGLPADAEQRLFRPFERLGAEQGGIDGTGIGLALSRLLVQAMGGVMGVHSQPGQGSTFWFRLPLVEARSQPEAPWTRPSAFGPLSEPAPPDPPASAPVSPLPQRRARALYIEDNPVNLMLMSAMLEDELDLDTEPDPLQGLARAQAQPPDLLLLDIQLPGIDGYEVLRRLRADARTRAIPVVAVSANAMHDDVAAGRAAGFDAYLTKPVDLDQLIDTVRSLLPALPPQA